MYLAFVTPLLNISLAQFDRKMQYLWTLEKWQYLWVNPMPQCLHLWGFSPVWVLRWRERLLESAKVLLQTPQDFFGLPLALESKHFATEFRFWIWISGVLLATVELPKKRNQVWEAQLSNDGIIHSNYLKKQFNSKLELILKYQIGQVWSNLTNP